MKKKASSKSQSTKAVSTETLPSSIAFAEAALLEAQNTLAALKKAEEDRIAAEKQELTNKINFLPEALGLANGDLVGLIKMVQTHMGVGQPKVGRRISDEIKDKVIATIKENKLTAAEIAKMFGVSVAYIAVKRKELGLTKPRNVAVAPAVAA